MKSIQGQMSISSPGSAVGTLSDGGSSQDPSAQVDSPNKKHAIEELAENRSHDRISMRTAVRVVAAECPHKTYRAWTDDLSPSGARIICEEPIEEDLLCLQVLMPELNEQFIVGNVIRAEDAKRHTFRNNGPQLYSYGIKFTAVRDVAEVEGLLAKVDES